MSGQEVASLIDQRQTILMLIKIYLHIIHIIYLIVKFWIDINRVSERNFYKYLS